jgi:diadenosine tetraphosphatase ApaH/serine/threonine PP2A family protein phosphatase
VHGNLPGLEAVLDELARVQPDLVVFGGDVAAGALPVETLDLLMGLTGARFVRGNADRELLDGSPGGLTEWAATQLEDRHRAFIESFEPTVVVDDVLYCHATPADDEPFVTVLTSDELAAETIGEVEQPVVVIGHTHSQFDRRLGSLRLVNAGSVGMPYEDEPGAYWALVDAGGPELRRTAYDLDAAAERIRASGWPIAERWVEENLLTVPTAREAAEFFERQRG